MTSKASKRVNYIQDTDFGDIKSEIEHLDFRYDKCIIILSS